jgi:hypothetical protein
VLTTLINPVVWLLAIVCVTSAVASRRGRLTRDAMAPLLALAHRPLVCGAIVVAAVSTAGPRIVLGYLAPGSYAEEVVAARTLLAGNGTRSTDDGEAFRRWLAEEPAPITPWTLPGLSSCQANAFESRAHFFTAQGHPPFLLLATVPLVAAFGGRGTFVVVTLLSLAAIALLARFRPGRRTRRAGFPLVAAAALLACWQPVAAALRQGDVALLVAALVLMTGVALERGHATRAGVAAGLAASVSIGALPLTLVVFVYSRRAGAVGLVTVVLASVATMLVAGPLVLLDYIDAVRTTSHAYAGTPFNYTLLGRVPWTAVAVGAAVAVAATAVLASRARRGAAVIPGGAGDGLAISVAAAAALVPLLCPVAWSQHLVVAALPASVLLACIWERNAAWLCTLALLLLAVSLPDRPVAWIAHLLAPESLKAVWPPIPLASLLILWAWLLVELRRGGAPVEAGAMAA